MRESFHAPPHPSRGPLLNAIRNFFEDPKDRGDRERRERIKRIPNDIDRERALREFEASVKRRKEKEAHNKQ